jgi:hypothetical protein
LKKGEKFTGRRYRWPPIVARAEEIVREYEETSVTLRQLFYRLVAEQAILNKQGHYQRLSELTAQARRDGTFPDLIDNGRTIHRYAHFSSVSEALDDLHGYYRRDRTEGQEVSLYLGVEKAGLIAQLQLWFGDLGLPVLALGGYASQTYVKDIRNDAENQFRDAVLLYAGDFDSTGIDIDRDFIKRTGCWKKVVRVALSSKQVEEYALPENLAKPNDPRNKSFKAIYGKLVQVEVDALPPDTLRALFQAAIDVEWDSDAYDAVMAEEREDRSRLADIIEAA